MPSSRVNRKEMLYDRELVFCVKWNFFCNYTTYLMREKQALQLDQFIYNCN